MKRHGSTRLLACPGNRSALPDRETARRLRLEGTPHDELAEWSADDYRRSNRLPVLRDVRESRRDRQCSGGPYRGRPTAGTRYDVRLHPPDHPALGLVKPAVNRAYGKLSICRTKGESYPWCDALSCLLPSPA